MAIAYSMLNQVTAGTIALVDMNKDKLEGEAKDLEQGSAFHQYVRILASDEYVSPWELVANAEISIQIFSHLVVSLEASQFRRTLIWSLSQLELHKNLENRV